MAVRLEGKRVSAAYGYSNRHGLLRGTLAEGVTTGEWVESNVATGSVSGCGPVRLAQSADGLSFSGGWKGSGLFSGGGAWTGRCPPEASPRLIRH